MDYSGSINYTSEGLEIIRVKDWWFSIRFHNLKFGDTTSGDNDEHGQQGVCVWKLYLLIK